MDAPAAHPFLLRAPASRTRVSPLFLLDPDFPSTGSLPSRHGQPPGQPWFRFPTPPALPPSLCSRPKKFPHPPLSPCSHYSDGQPGAGGGRESWGGGRHVNVCGEGDAFIGAVPVGGFRGEGTPRPRCTRHPLAHRGRPFPSLLCARCSLPGEPWRHALKSLQPPDFPQTKTPSQP